MDWWLTYLTLRGKIIDINPFKIDIIDDSIEDSRIYFEDTRYGKGDLSNPKWFSHEKWDQWEDSIYNYLTSRENSRSLPLSYVIRKDVPSHKDIENRDVKIIYQSSLVGNCRHKYPEPSKCYCEALLTYIETNLQSNFQIKRNYS